MNVDMTYETLNNIVIQEFELDGENWKANLSYWMPGPLSVFSCTYRPPVTISTDMGVRNFMRVMESGPQLNLLLSVESVPYMVEGVRVELLQECGKEKSCQKTTAAESSGAKEISCFQSAAALLKETNDAECSRRRERENVGTGIGRNIMVNPPTEGRRVVRPTEAAECDYVEGNDCVVPQLKESTPQELFCTSGSRIINLADATTPSLSYNSSEDVSVDVLDGEDDQTDEDMQMLKEIEAVEMRELAKLKSKGKQKICDSGDDAEEASHTDGFSDSTSDEDEVWEYEGWSHLMCNDAPPGEEDNVMEEGEPSVAAQQENAESVGPPIGREDISAAVLGYHGTTTPLPLQEGNIYEENGSDLALSDAEPVFDDVYNLTFVDGCAPASSEEDAIYIGRVFKDKEHMRTTLAIYAIKRLFHFRQTRSDPGRLIFVCVDRRCPWRVYAVSPGNESKNFKVRTMTLTHTCTIASRAQYGKQASAKVIARVLKGKYANGMPGPRAVDIPDIVLAELKVSVTYMKAGYAKEAAIMQTRGSDADSYKLLAVYMHLLQQGNPGTKYKLEYSEGLDGEKQFKYLFFSMGASIAGMKFMRKVVLVDGTAIKAKFKGMLLTASMQDANFMVFPIAFGIVDSESEPAWTWFFRQLSSILTDSKDLVIVSDRHRSIYAGVGQVYPKAFHGACAVHIERNVRVKFPKKGVSNLVSKAARAFNVGDFREFYTEIERRSKGCAEYLEAIPKDHWTQAYCEARRYNIMSSNVAEALNSALAKIVELPIVTMVEAIRTKLMKWFCVRRAKAAKLKDGITPNAHKLMLRHHAASAGLAVLPVSAWSYQVNTVEGKAFYVDLQKKSCSCLQFDKLEIPCCHALAAGATAKVHIPSLAGNWYKVSVWGNSYAEFILPVPNQCDEVVPPAVEGTKFIPPTNPNGPGRRRKNRIPSAGEFKVLLKNL